MVFFVYMIIVSHLRLDSDFEQDFGLVGVYISHFSETLVVAGSLCY